MRALVLTCVFVAGCGVSARDALVRASDMYYAVCGREGSVRSEECNVAKDKLNEAIDAYNADAATEAAPSE